MTEPNPVFLAGTDRSGIGLLGETLDRHSRISISRRTRFWTLYYERYGDLSDPANAKRAVDALMSYTRIADLGPDRDRLIAELGASRGRASYADLFRLIQTQHLEKTGKDRWGDKTLNAERHADIILDVYPTAKMIHVVRDPRDRYASQALHRRASRGKVGAGSALWLSSVRRGRRHLEAYAGRYMLVRYEDLVSRPRQVVQDVCEFIDEAFEASMLAVPALPRTSDDTHIERVGSDRTFTTKSIGRYRHDLTHPEIAFIQLVTRRQMRSLGYEMTPVSMTRAERLRFWAVYVPVNLGYMAAWWFNMELRERTGGSPSQRRTVEVT